LLVHSFGRDFAPWNEYAKGFRAELDRQRSEPVDFYETSLASFQTSIQEGQLIDYLCALFGNHQLDLIVALGSPATSFFQQHRQQFFPSTPLLLVGAEQRPIVRANLSANDTFLTYSIDSVSSVESILRVRPKTTNIAVVIGNSPVETYWLGQ